MTGRKTLLTLVTLSALAVPASAAAVNCAQVNKYLGTGRSVQDVAETMIIPEAEVRKCQQEASGGASGSPASAPTPGIGGATKAK
jgi:hypothetical protein